MKILVFGSTGRTGSLVVAEALKRGHEVTAFARNPAKVSAKSDKLKIQKGDATDPVPVQTAIVRQDAVVYCIQVESGISTIPQETTRRIYKAMELTGTMRLIWVSGWGVGDSKRTLPFMARTAIGLTMGDVYAERGRCEEMVRGSALSWTLVRAAPLNDGPAKGYATSVDGKGLNPKLSRADLAAFIVDEIEKNEWVKKMPIVASK
jgi:putative NADH-flavin reductase